MAGKETAIMAAKIGVGALKNTVSSGFSAAKNAMGDVARTLSGPKTGTAATTPNTQAQTLQQQQVIQQNYALNEAVKLLKSQIENYLNYPNIKNQLELSKYKPEFTKIINTTIEDNYNSQFKSFFSSPEYAPFIFCNILRTNNLYCATLLQAYLDDKTVGDKKLPSFILFLKRKLPNAATAAATLKGGSDEVISPDIYYHLLAVLTEKKITRNETEKIIKSIINEQFEINSEDAKNIIQKNLRTFIAEYFQQRNKLVLKDNDNLTVAFLSLLETNTTIIELMNNFFNKLPSQEKRQQPQQLVELICGAAAPAPTQQTESAVTQQTHSVVSRATITGGKTKKRRKTGYSRKMGRKCSHRRCRRRRR